MNVHTLLEKLEASGLCVFRTSDVARLLGGSRSSAAVYVHRMKKIGMIHSVERGKFSISEDPFCVASQLVVPSYISFSTALYLHGRLDQVIDNIYIVTPRKKEGLTYFGMDIKFVKFPASRVFGYRKHAKGSSNIMLADLEKTAVDCLYMPRYLPVSVVRDALSQGFDKLKFERYALMMKSEAVIRRAGFLLNALGEDTDISVSTPAPYTLNPAVGKKGKYDNRWKLYVNEVIT